MTDTGLPLSWVLGALLTVCGLWLTVLLAVIAQQRAFGATEAKIDFALGTIIAMGQKLDIALSSIGALERKLDAALGTIVVLESRMQGAEMSADLIRERHRRLAALVQRGVTPGPIAKIP